MKLADSANPRVVDVEVDHEAGYRKAQRRVQRVQERSVRPSRLELFLVTLLFFLGFLLAANCSLRGCGCGELDDVCNEQVTWHRSEQYRPQNNVLPTVVVAFDADQYSILDIDRTLAMVNNCVAQ